MGRKAGAGGDQKLILGAADHGQIAFDATLGVQHLGVGQRSGGAVDVACGDPGQRLGRVGAFQGELGEGGLVDQHGMVAGRLVFARHRIPPAGALVGIAVLCHFARCGEPVRAFPAQLFAKHRPGGLQMRIQRRAAGRAGGAHFLGRPGDGVVFGVSLQRAAADVIGGAVGRAETADVDGPEVIGRGPGGDPFCEGHACPAPGGDAEGVEARADIEVAQFRRLAQDEIPVRGKAFRPVDQLFDACGGQGWHARQGVFHELAVVIPVRGQEFKVEPLGDAVLRPGLRVRLIAAPDQAANLLFPVGQPVGVAQGGQRRGDAVDPFGDHVLVFDRDEGDVDADRGCQRAGPLTGADDEFFAFHGAGGGFHPPNAAILDDNAGDRRILENLHPRHPRATGKGLGDVRRVGLAVGRQVGGTDQIVDGHQGPKVLCFFRGQEVHLQPEGMRGGGLAFHLGPAFGVAGKAQAAVHLPAGLQARLRLQPFVKGDGMAQQLGDVGRCAQLADQARGVKGGAGGQLLAFEKHRIGPAKLAQMVGHGTADDAAADDDGARGGWKIGHREFL